MGESRKENRFPCVGITLLYSPLEDESVHHLAELLQEATSNDMSLGGLSFDVTEPMEPGSRLYVLIQADDIDETKEHLITCVRWVKRVAEQCYRVGVSIESVEQVDKCNPGVHIPIGTEELVPSAIQLYCPACGKLASFKSVGKQRVSGKRGVVPLYDCSCCSTTRSLVNILKYNRNKK